MTEKRIHDAKFETASASEIQSYQLAQLTALLEATNAQNPFFREHWKKAGVDPLKIRSLEEFSKRVPLVEKSDFIIDQENAPPYGLRHRHVLSLGVPLVTMTSSGTSGFGVEIHLQTNEDMANHSRMNAYYFRWAGLAQADTALLTMHISMLAGGRCEYHAAVDYGLSVYPAAMYDTQRRIDLIKRFKPKALLGTSSYFGHLAASAKGDLQDLGIEVLLTGAEATSVPWFQRLEAQFGAKAFDRYGLSPMATDHMFTCERGIGTPGNPGVLHNIDPFVVMEVIDPSTGEHVEDGQAGELVFTSLYRHDTPMIRCRTRDRGIYRAPGSCACGRPFAGIEIGSIGRLDDMKKIKGINVWPQAVEDLIFAHELVDEYQVQLTTADGAGDVATLRILPRAALSAVQKASIIEELTSAVRQKIGIGFVVEVVDAGAFGRSEYKARRWVDNRDHVTS